MKILISALGARGNFQPMLALAVSLIVGACTIAPTSPPITLTPSSIPAVTLVLPSPSAPPAPLLATVQMTPAATISAEAERYLNDALDILQTHSLKRADIDWPTLRANTLRRARTAQELADTYEAIRYALGKLGDHHSFFLDPVQSANLTQVEISDAPDPEGELVNEKLGYVVLPTFWSGNQALISEYASQVRDIIRTLDSNNPCGWVVDVRQNRGGNMWPMLAGIGPILGEGHVGAFIEPNGQQMDWFYADGASRRGGEIAAQVNGEAYQLQRLNPPVAVLIGPLTASSGEAVVIAFQGRPNTRSFGWITMGLTTANNGYPLSDGATIVLTVATFADRTGQQYGKTIAADDIVSDLPNTVQDEVIVTASQWLMEQPACANSQ